MSLDGKQRGEGGLVASYGREGTTPSNLIIGFHTVQVDLLTSHAEFSNIMH